MTTSMTPTHGDPLRHGSRPLSDGDHERWLPDPSWPVPPRGWQLWAAAGSTARPGRAGNVDSGPIDDESNSHPRPLIDETVDVKSEMPSLAVLEDASFTLPTRPSARVDHQRVDLLADRPAATGPRGHGRGLRGPRCPRPLQLPRRRPDRRPHRHRRLDPARGERCPRAGAPLAVAGRWPARRRAAPRGGRHRPHPRLGRDARPSPRCRGPAAARPCRSAPTASPTPRRRMPPPPDAVRDVGRVHDADPASHPLDRGRRCGGPPDAYRACPAHRPAAAESDEPVVPVADVTPAATPRADASAPASGSTTGGEALTLKPDALSPSAVAPVGGPGPKGATDDKGGKGSKGARAQGRQGRQGRQGQQGRPRATRAARPRRARRIPRRRRRPRTRRRRPRRTTAPKSNGTKSNGAKSNGTKSNGGTDKNRKDQSGTTKAGSQPKLSQAGIGGSGAAATSVTGFSTIPAARAGAVSLRGAAALPVR